MWTNFSKIAPDSGRNPPPRALIPPVLPPIHPIHPGWLHLNRPIQPHESASFARFRAGIGPGRGESGALAPIFRQRSPKNRSGSV
ncbi:hypothetical protein STA1M1_06940 [Sinisalibacter aestuarii]|uniref:Uncharacterized protein n=1 Tax=Sinisalibacter aestuarii TaxID=2949426 RepID=A0ABQ5LP93_9RHOB|nr:hypothetical protein STA1M1_06940 [Sinisalibacter aestuarii]